MFSLTLTVYEGHVQLMPLGSCVRLGFSDRSRTMFLFFLSSWIFKLFSRWNPCFRKDLHFLYFCLQSMRLYFAPARGSPVSVRDHVMTSQVYIKVDYAKTWLFSSSLAKFQEFWSECFFFKFCLVYFLLFTRALSNWRVQGPCVPLVFFERSRIMFLFFLSEIFKLFSP